MKLINKPVPVKSSNGNPVLFSFRGSEFKVQDILDLWKDVGEWWNGEGEKAFYRVSLVGHGLAEVYYDEKEMKWYLYSLLISYLMPLFVYEYTQMF